MNISVKSEYALLAIFDLALNGGSTPVKIADIANRQHIPQKFLELILAGLKQGGFVESRRGAEGGYLLTRAADGLSVGEVLRFVEDNKQTKRIASNPFHQIWQQVDAAVATILDHTTFAELARTWQKSQTRYVANWDI